MSNIFLFDSMNFITRNFGWVLLVLFFIFMFFLITIWNPDKASNEDTLSGAIETLSDTWEAIEDEVDELIAIVQDEVISDEKGTESLDDKKAPKDRDAEKDSKEEKKSILEKIFWKDDEEKSLKEESDDVVEESISSQEADVSEADEQSSNQSLTAEQQYYISEYLTEPKTQKLPGVNLETKIGNTYAVAVHSLKLNNKYFNETLGYLMKGDTLRQITPENSYGCFAVEVLESSHATNSGKKGFVCKKWLEESSNVVVDEVVVVPVDSEIGTVLLAQEDTMIDGYQISSGDIVDQLSSPVDGSAQFLVRSANILATQWQVILISDMSSFQKVK